MEINEFCDGRKRGKEVSSVKFVQKIKDENDVVVDDKENQNGVKLLKFGTMKGCSVKNGEVQERAGSGKRSGLH